MLDGKADAALVYVATPGQLPEWMISELFGAVDQVRIADLPDAVPAFPDTVLAIRPHVSADLRQRLQKALLETTAETKDRSALEASRLAHWQAIDDRFWQAVEWAR